MPFADNYEHRLYDRWRGMIRRCTDPNHISYQRYGGRGITVDPAWMGPDGFRQWLADMGEPPTPKHEIDRIDNNGPYTKTNCRWVLPVQQMANRRDNRVFVLDGETKNCAEWARDPRVVLIGLTEDILRKRHMAGWPSEDALGLPSDRNAPSERRGSKNQQFIEDVQKIRALKKAGSTEKQICEATGLRQAKVNKILNGKLGRYVPHE